MMYAGVVLGGMGSIGGAFCGRPRPSASCSSSRRSSCRCSCRTRRSSACFLLIVLAAARGALRRSDGARMTREQRPAHDGGSAAFAARLSASSRLVERNSNYQLILTLVLVWAVMGVAWNVLSAATPAWSRSVTRRSSASGRTSCAARAEPLDVTPWIGVPIADAWSAASPASCRLSRRSVCAGPTSRSRCSPTRSRSSISSSGWGYQEVAAADDARGAGRVHAVRGPPGLHRDRARHRSSGRCASDAHDRALALSASRSRAIKQNETAAEASGIDTLAGRLKAIMVSGAIAAAAGGFYAVVLLIVTPPTVFGMLTSAQALIVTLFGGVATVWGPVVGAVILIPLAEILPCRARRQDPGHPGRRVRGRDRAGDPHRARRPGAEAPRPACAADADRRAARAARRAHRRTCGAAGGRRGSPAAGREGLAVVRRLAGGPGRELRSPQGRGARGHRPQRRRQDHALQPPERVHPPRCRRSGIRRQAAGRPQAERGVPAGSGGRSR